jgi:hypothetical protein
MENIVVDTIKLSRCEAQDPIATLDGFPAIWRAQTQALALLLHGVFAPSWQPGSDGELDRFDLLAAFMIKGHLITSNGACHTILACFKSSPCPGAI